MSDAARKLFTGYRSTLGRFGRLASRRADRRGTLFRKYVLLIVGLVSLVLLLNSVLDFWFSYEENKTALVHIQQEKAASAARRIEQFVDEIERQLGWTTAPQWAASPLDQRRFDYVRLLRQVPAITELIQLDDNGKEQLKVSRLAMDVVASGSDFSQSPGFIEAKKHRVWFSPVYFRKESEPYMTMAVARSGRNAGVTIAEVNLKLIWDVITGLKIGEGGYAYVVDRDGRLIAHPDISLVLRNTDLTTLPQVAAAHAEAAGEQTASPAVMVAKSLYGASVLTAHAAIAPLGWTVFVELPLKEALAPLYGSALRTGALLVLALLLATLAALLLARRMTVPIRQLQAGAARIGAGELARRIEIHTGDELEGLAGEFNRMAGDLQKSYADLEKKVEDRTAELRESLEQQTATSEVLGVINSSPGNLSPVFDALLEKALSLCDAAFGALVLREGEYFRSAATRGLTPRFAESLSEPFTLDPSSTVQRLIRGDPVVHIADISELPIPESAQRQELIRLGGARTFLQVPLRRDSSLLGIFSIYRQEVRPFTDKQIALLQNFAAQAVIAMENARLITETREALEQQTATAGVLQVINSSPGDLAPVFDAILEKAHTLCGAAHGGFNIYDGERFRNVAAHAIPPRFAELMRQPFHARPVQQRLLRGERYVHVPDMMTSPRGDPNDPIGRASDEAGIRTLLVVPLRKDGVLLGYITAHREEVRPFSDKHIGVLQNFAAQAVIAMENARLITETREALEQQTATAEVLGVINTSPGELQPVFDAMLEKALHLCEAASGLFWTFDGERAYVRASRDVPAEFLNYLEREPPGAGPDTFFGRAILTRSVIHSADIAAEEPYRRGVPLPVAAVELGGIHAALFVPLLKDNTVPGIFSIFRKEVRPFTEKQIALLQNFAAQAVIAMENARLLTETREALEQQTATAEVLQVINSSPGELAPVFDAILEKAHSLCGAASGHLMTWDGECFETVAIHGEMGGIPIGMPVRPKPGFILDRIARGEPVIHVTDVFADPAYHASPYFHEIVEVGGVRTMLYVALRREDALLGVIGIYNRAARAFTDKQIALLQNFAAQAVIAMENARLITELRQRTRDLQESLEYQTATSDVLKVISRSAFELEPVLKTVVETAARLCLAEKAIIYRHENGAYRYAVGYGNDPEYEQIERDTPIYPGQGTLIGRMALEKRTVQIADAWSDPLYEFKDQARSGNVRTMIGVPLIRDGAVGGAIALARGVLEPFTEKQIELVTVFAHQAVIAIENARLFNELRARTAELGRSVDELKMLSEVGQAVSSTLDLRAVLSTILTRSVGLAGAEAGVIYGYSRAQRAFRFVEAAGYSEAMVREVRELDIPENMTGMGEAIARRAPLHIPDLRERTSNPLRDQALGAGFRSVLIVPLVGPERILGALVLQRRATGEFPPETVRLMQTLASQSVLAIQNARLFREIADKSEQLALASQHKSQFLANMSHELRTPLNAILGYAELLVDGIYGQLPERPRGVLERIQNNGTHLLALINDVLDLAKIEAGQLTLTLEDYSLPEAVRSVVIATEPLASSKGLKFTAAIADDLPTAHGDARRMSQVLMNLVGNAIKFTDQGEVEIRATTEKGQFVLTVRDTGPGIADADQERIFGEFQQIDNSNTRKKGGTGLGLAISKRMVEMQGGTISVDSVLGKGSTFRVVLPVHVDEMMEEAA